MASYDNNTRRMFRGRGGPTDRNLPKHQARRRKCHHIKQDPVTGAPTHTDKQRHDDEGEEIDEEITLVEEKKEESQHLPAPNSNESKPVVYPHEKEIKHLRKRIENIQESIQLSSAISKPETWKSNVLNVVQKCVGEWRSIMTHYPDLDQETTKEPSTRVFMLIQLSMQSGPLAGGKPGYFKRCGGSVAKQALSFLETVVPDEEQASVLKFSSKQSEAIETWKTAASKAVTNNKPPSKSALKKQTKS